MVCIFPHYLQIIEIQKRAVYQGYLVETES